MDKYAERKRARRIRYWRRTWRNKVCALTMLLAGILSVCIDYDATFLVATVMFAIPLFFSNENWIL